MRSLSLALILGASLGLGLSPTTARAQRFFTGVPRSVQVQMPIHVLPLNALASQRFFAAQSDPAFVLRNISLANAYAGIPRSTTALYSPGSFAPFYGYPLHNPYAALRAYTSGYQMGYGSAYAMSPYSGYSSPYLQAGSGGYGSGGYGSGGYGSGYQQPASAYSAPQTLSTPPASPPADVQTQGNPIVTVGLYDNMVEPRSMTISVGTTVRWKNHGSHLHTVTSDTGVWDSRELDPGKTYSFTFTRPGTYAYHCVLHPEKMQGVVIVKE